MIYYVIVFAYVIPLIYGFYLGYRRMYENTIWDMLRSTPWVCYIPALNLLVIIILIVQAFFNIRIK